MIYCPYTDRDIPDSRADSEHIIPLSLGGVNGFEIPVDADFNSRVGSELDGALANEFMWVIARTEYDALGHSGKEPKATIKDASYGDENRVAQVHFHKKKGVSVWDVRDREFKSRPGPIRISTSMNIDLPMRLTSKVALAAGYYVYGDVLRQYVDHQQLRDVMNIDPSKLDLTKSPDELGISHINLIVDDWTHHVPSNQDLQCVRLFCSAVRGSVVMLIPARDQLSVAVGILGQYLAMVTVPAETEAFPKDGEYTWGHVIALSKRQIFRTSLADGLSQFVEADYHTEMTLPLTPLRQLPREEVEMVTNWEAFRNRASAEED